METETAPPGPTPEPGSAASASPDVSDVDRRILELERPHQNLLLLYALQSLAGLVFAPFILIPLYFRYHTLRYDFDDEGISARWGILFRREIHLTYKRIQDIHVKRNILERWLGIGSVEVQTASGASSAELTIEGMQEFEAVRDFLYRRMRGHESQKAPEGSEATVASSGSASEAELLALLRGIREELEATRKAIEGGGPGGGA